MSESLVTSASVRRRRACEAALGVATRLGIRAQDAVILADRNNTVVWLRPAPVVAKVGTSHFGDVGLESLERELAVAEHLASHQAPCVRPARDIPPGPHHCQELVVTLWQRLEPAPCVVFSAVETAATIKAVHDALLDFDGDLPLFSIELDDANRLLEADRSPGLRPADRRFLVGVAAELQAELAALSPACRPLHGSPHDANWLQTADGLVLLDFETACMGPVEWDLAALGDDVIALFPGVDRGLIQTMRRLRSVCVAAKCWVAPERAPEVREAADVHLRLLRGEPVD